MVDESHDVHSDDIIRVLIATDNHLGYLEKDPIRGNDSFIAFEEILELAVIHNVDFILLGGDLFHDAVPSQNALHKCIKLLRRYTFGDKPISVEFLNNEQAEIFHGALNQTVNYEDPNLNISIPVFSIHGNHDDPSGFGRLSSLDLLSTSGLVNYFGRWTDLTQIVIKPLMLRKGNTQMAIYGLSHIHDARLARLFENYKVTIEHPSKEDGEWFHLMVLHQNRAVRGLKNYLPEEILPEFLNLIIWGHEHDCRIQPEFNDKKDFYVSQPGSSVATSLAEGESLKKHVGLLEIYKNKFQMKPLPLQTVRPFIFESINLTDKIEELGTFNIAEKIKLMAEKRIEKMIEKSKELLTGHAKQPTTPLIRLRLVFTEETQMFNAIRFGQMYNELVANPTDIVHFKKLIKRNVRNPIDFDKEVIKNEFEKMDIDKNVRIGDIVDRYFENVDDTKSLNVMNSKVLSEMCYRLIEKRDPNAAENIVKFCKRQAVNHLMDKLPNADDIDEHLRNLKDQLTPDSISKIIDSSDFESVSAYKSLRSSANDEFAVSATTNEDSDHENEQSPKASAASNRRGTKAKNDTNNKSTTRGRGRGRGGARGGARGANNRTNSMPKLNISINATDSTNRNSKQPSLLDAIKQKQAKQTKPLKTYVICSDDSD